MDNKTEINGNVGKIELHAVDESSIVPFENRRITTMVCIVRLSGEILPAQAFTLLPIPTLGSLNRNGNVKTLPHNEIPGSILSMRFENEIRGMIIRVKKSTHFRNSITIDMSIKDKNVNFRLSKSTIHMCGVKSFEQINETVQLLFEHLRKVQDDLQYLQQNPIQVSACFKFIQSNIRSTDKSGNKILYFQSDPELIEPKLDLRILNFMKRNLADHTTAVGFLTELKWILAQTHVYIGELSIVKIETSMINKNYDIGFEINRRALARYIKQIGDFYLDYDNAVTHSVKIMLPFDIPSGPEGTVRRKKKKDEIPHHTFMVYKSGCVTQSGPSLELMNDAYLKFFKAIYGLRHLIERNTGKDRKVVPKGRITIRIVKPSSATDKETDKNETDKNETDKKEEISDQSETASENQEEELRIEDIPTESDI